MNQQEIPIKKDLLVSLIIGEILAWLFLILAKGVLPIELYQKTQSFLKMLLIFLPLVCAVCLYLAYLINKKIIFVYQVAKFVLVGGLNTFLDLGILTLLIILFQDYFSKSQDDALLRIFSVTVVYYSLYKAISFVIAVANSYLWNKFWTFVRKTKEKIAAEFIQFLVVSFLGFLVNVGIASVMNYLLNPLIIFSAAQRGILAAVVATIFAMTWNFLGYRFIVFDQKKPASPSSESSSFQNTNDEI